LIGVARDCGYAVALHGSVKRDLDVVAVPWTEDAVSADRLLREFANVTGGYYRHQKPAKKPHGRIAYALVLDNAGGDAVYIDVSVMPRGGDRG
jgi:hypothetical protein